MTRTYKVGIKLDTNTGKYECTQLKMLTKYNIAMNYLYNLYIKVQVGLLQAKEKNYPYKEWPKERFKSLPEFEKNRYYTSAASMEKDILNAYIRKAKWYNNWLEDVPQKTRKQAFRDAETAFKRMFNGLGGKPKFKGRKSTLSVYFDTPIHVDRAFIKLPKIGRIRLAEYGYLPTDKQLKASGYKINSARVSCDAGHWYVSVVTTEPSPVVKTNLKPNSLQGLGLDLGIKTFVTTNYAINKLPSGLDFGINLTNTTYYKHVENYKNMWVARLGRRIAELRKRLNLGVKGHIGNNTTKGIIKARNEVKRWYRKLRNISKNYIREVVDALVKQKPDYITVENLNVKGMKANSKLAPALQKLSLSGFKQWLIWECSKHGIEVREISRWQATTKICSDCGKYNYKQFNGTMKDLAVRIFICPYCGLSIDRDQNAAINIANSKHYKVINLPLEKKKKVSTKKATKIKQNINTTV